MQQMVAYEVMRKELQASRLPKRGFAPCLAPGWLLLVLIAGVWLQATPAILQQEKVRAALCLGKLHLRMPDSVVAQEGDARTRPGCKLCMLSGACCRNTLGAVCVQGDIA